MSEQDGWPHVGTFNSAEGLILDQHPNGGWTISQKNISPGNMDTQLGAYSDSRDMLNALVEALCPELFTEYPVENHPGTPTEIVYKRSMTVEDAIEEMVSALGKDTVLDAIKNAYPTLQEGPSIVGVGDGIAKVDTSRRKADQPSPIEPE